MSLRTAITGALHAVTRGSFCRKQRDGWWGGHERELWLNGAS